MMLSPRDAYRRWAPTYDESPNPIVSLIDRHLDLAHLRGKIAVDVACGTGRRAAKFGAIGVDLSFEMLSQSTGRKVQADARHLPFSDGVAGLVLCTLALGYIDPARDLMNELRRITRPGGIVIAADLHPTAVAAGWKRTFRADGANCEIESHPYSLDDLSVDGLTLDEARDLHFGEPEWEIYQRAGKASLFDGARRVPAVWIRKWRRL